MIIKREKTLKKKKIILAEPPKPKVEGVGAPDPHTQQSISSPTLSPLRSLGFITNSPPHQNQQNPFSVLHVFCSFCDLFCGGSWIHCHSWTSWKRQKSRFWVWLWLLWQLWLGLHISIPPGNPKVSHLFLCGWVCMDVCVFDWIGVFFAGLLCFCTLYGISIVGLVLMLLWHLFFFSMKRTQKVSPFILIGLESPLLTYWFL